MIKIVLYVIALAVLVTVAVWFADEPGRVSVAWHGWRMDTSVAILFVILGALLAGGALLIRIWGALAGAGRAFKESRRARRTATGLDALAAGFAAVQGEDAAGAKRALKTAEAALGESAAVRLLKQQTARISHDSVSAAADARDMLSEPALELAALRDLAELARVSGDFDGALSQAKRAMGHKPAPPWAVSMTLDLQIATERWADAAAMLDRKDTQALLKEVDLPRLRAALASRAATACVAEQKFDDAISWARKALAADATRADAAAALARALNATGKTKKAASELAKAWTINPHPALLGAFLELAPGEAPLARAGRIDTLVKDNPDHAESRLAVAEASLAAELWGQARNKLEPLLSDDSPDPVRARAAALMAQVELGERSDTAAAAKALTIALEARTAAPVLPAPASAADLLTRPY